MFTETPSATVIAGGNSIIYDTSILREQPIFYQFAMGQPVAVVVVVVDET